MDKLFIYILQKGCANNLRKFSYWNLWWRIAPDSSSVESGVGWVKFLKSAKWLEDFSKSLNNLPSQV